MQGICAEVGIEIDGQLQTFETGDIITGLEGGDAYIGREFSLDFFGIAKIDKANYGLLVMLKDFKGNNSEIFIFSPNKALSEVSSIASWELKTDAGNGLRSIETSVVLKSITIKEEDMCTKVVCGDGFCSEKETSETCSDDCGKMQSGVCGKTELSVNGGAPFDQNISGTYDINRDGVPYYSLFFDEIITGSNLNYVAIAELRTLDGNPLEKAVLAEGNILSNMFQEGTNFDDEIEIANTIWWRSSYPCEFVEQSNPYEVKGYAEIVVEGERKILEEGEMVYGLTGRNNCPQSVSMKFEALTIRAPFPSYGSKFNLYDDQNSPLDEYGYSVNPPVNLRDVLLDNDYGDYCLDTNVVFERAYPLAVD